MNARVKFEQGWWWPHHEEHMLAWMKSPKNKFVMNGRATYQGVKQFAVLKHCKRFRTVIDVGGHVGLWSWNFMHKFQHVHAFEPVELHRACFSKNVLDHKGDRDVKLYAVALGDTTGSVDIWTEQGSSGNSFVKGDGNIPLRTLDSFGFTDVDLIKIDCEGFEEKVLRGAIETVRANRPTVIVEQKRDMAARFGLELLGAVKVLKDEGYKVVEEISGDYIMVPM
jgi:FkbM family methyltransferase